MSTENKEEQWKPVVGYEGLYEVSDQGRVKTLNYRGNMKIPAILQQNNHNLGYKQLDLSKGGKIKRFKTHRLVAGAFLGPANGRIVDHIDGDKSNNRASNLRYCTHRENLTFNNVRYKRPKASKYSGVSYNRNSNGKNKWRAILKHNKKTYSLGAYASEEEARDAYLNKLKSLEV